MTQQSDHNAQILDQFGRQAEGYARLIDSMRPRAPSPMLALLGPRPDDVVLDVACGSGSLALEVAPAVKHVTGVDLTPAMIDQARIAQAEREIRNVEWTVSDVCPLPFEDGAFSLVLCRAAVHHFARPRDVVREMCRVGAEGARIAIIDMAFEPDRGAAFDAVEKMRDPSHVHAHSLDELRALAGGLALEESVVELFPPTEMPLEAILATSYPTGHTIEDVRRLIQTDAESGDDKLGLRARVAEGRILVSYPMAMVMWTKGAGRQSAGAA